MQDTLGDLGGLPTTALTTAALVVVMAAIAVYDPVAGRRQHRAFLAALERGEKGVRARFYRSWIAQGGATAAVAVLLTAVLPGLTPAGLGLRTPDLSGVARILPAGSAAVVVGAVVGAALVGLLLGVVARSAPPRTPPIAGAEALLPMLPRTRTERWWWAGLSLSAGVVEEITYRGLLVLAVVGLWPDVPVAVVLVVGGVVFGVAHWYQGPAGMAATGVAGLAFMALYLATASLLVPMVLHVLVDLRALTIRPPDATAGSTTPGTRTIASPGHHAPRSGAEQAPGPEPA